MKRPSVLFRTQGLKTPGMALGVRGIIFTFKPDQLDKISIWVMCLPSKAMISRSISSTLVKPAESTITRGAFTGDLLSDSARFFYGPAEAFLRELEKTAMTRAYKIPTIGALLTDGTILKQVSLSNIGEQFMSFYQDHPLHQKDLRDQSNQAWRTWTIREFTRLARQNPVRFLSRSKFFNYDEINKIFYLSDDLSPYLNNELAAHVRDILEYRRLNYFRKRFKEEG